jgi:hypothetical protein
MTDKQKHILDYLFDHNGQDFYINIREFVGSNFDNEDDFDDTLKELENLNLVSENEKGNTYYKLTFTDLKVEYAIPHVTLFYTKTDEAILRIEDYELFDTFDDILTEQFDFDNYSHTTEQKGNLRICTIYFPENIDREKLNKAVRSIDEKEVEEIFRINNLQ